jgi:acyl-CoA dehydrogenase
MRLAATELSADDQRLREDVRALLPDRRPPGSYELAQMSAPTALSVDRAAAATLAGAASFEIVVTKSFASCTAGLAAHQAHGAAGVTQEYALQLLTRRLHTWRADFGDEASMNLRLGAATARHGGITKAATASGSTIGV